MRLFLGLLVIWGGLLISGLSYSRDPQTSIPPAPTERSQRFGIYNWNIDDRAYDSATTTGSIGELTELQLSDPALFESSSDRATFTISRFKARRPPATLRN
jgi:hypothetical protein